MYITDDGCIPVANPCFSVTGPCLNGGICDFTDCDFTCKCPSTHTGTYCQDPVVNPCHSGDHLCENGATCIPDKIGIGYVCQCTNCYGGEFCEFAKPVFNPCFNPDNNPCSNGGTCDFTDCTFTCICPPGYTGTLCEDIVCKTLECKFVCPFGNVIDENGCPTCDCLPAPCDEGDVPVNCFVSPCQFATCSVKPSLCINNFCKGCDAVFYDVKGNIIEECPTVCPQIKCANPCPFGTEVTSEGCPTCSCLPNPDPCPDGSEPSVCKKNPCDDTICEVNPMTSCVPNYCGGCFVDFYDRNLNIDAECLETNCRGDLVFNECASACPQTCDNPDIVCRALCRPGCACPKGKILKELYSTKCVVPQSCNCKGLWWRGRCYTLDTYWK
ncbi:neurogenic locus notch homolog protein 1-like [Anneissia japonica]|uniref:neurogenic locus notch homolog protein 1-like n=1 Tax=Anneissia japonica TaxID=1529436 RepID=UPI00142577A1|nr:neurogenic locus notch homolog protein 1-like [Anneissia japonica]